MRPTSRPQARAAIRSLRVVIKLVPHRGPRSKQALVIEMLSKKQGVTLDALVKATCWLPHTTQAAVTRLRKRGFAVERIQLETRGSLYRITSHPAFAPI